MIANSIFCFFHFVRVAEIFRNQKKLESEAKVLQNLATKYTKQTSQWLSMIESFNNALKELGDVQSWALSIENDMRAISNALEYVHQGKFSFLFQLLLLIQNFKIFNININRSTKFSRS